MPATLKLFFRLYQDFEAFLEVDCLEVRKQNDSDASSNYTPPQNFKVDLKVLFVRPKPQNMLRGGVLMSLEAIVG